MTDFVQMTAPCGLDCFNCPVYLANENDILRQTIAENLGIPAESAVCQGCRNEKGIIGIIQKTDPCPVYTCTSEQGIHNCSECPEFPCDYLHPYADRASSMPHNTKLFNLCLIKKMGIESWAETKAKEVKEAYYNAKLWSLAKKVKS